MITRMNWKLVINPMQVTFINIITTTKSRNTSSNSVKSRINQMERNAIILGQRNVAINGGTERPTKVRNDSAFHTIRFRN